MGLVGVETAPVQICGVAVDEHLGVGINLPNIAMARPGHEDFASGKRIQSPKSDGVFLTRGFHLDHPELSPQLSPGNVPLDHPAVGPS